MINYSGSKQAWDKRPYVYGLLAPIKKVNIDYSIDVKQHAIQSVIIFTSIKDIAGDISAVFNTNKVKAFDKVCDFGQFACKYKADLVILTHMHLYSDDEYS